MSVGGMGSKSTRSSQWQGDTYSPSKATVSSSQQQGDMSVGGEVSKTTSFSKRQGDKQSVIATPPSRSLHHSTLSRGKFLFLSLMFFSSSTNFFPFFLRMQEKETQLCT
jgi:hypothetical protein